MMVGIFFSKGQKKNLSHFPLQNVMNNLLVCFLLNFIPSYLKTQKSKYVYFTYFLDTNRL